MIGRSTIKECLEHVTAVLQNHVSNLGKTGKVFGIIVFIQAGAILKGIIFNEIYVVCIVFYLISPKTL